MRELANPRLMTAPLLAVGLMAASVLLPMRALGADPALAGQALVFDRAKGNCLACHAVKGGDVPSNVGPGLSDMKKRFPDRNELYGIIYDEEQRNPETVMPPFGKNLILDPKEINEVIDFLYTL